MIRLLESYAAGRWYAASAEGDPLLDAATGEEVARISSAGLDLGAMAHHARTVGVELDVVAPNGSPAQQVLELVRLPYHLLDPRPS